MFGNKVKINQALETKSSKENQAVHIYSFQEDQHRKKNSMWLLLERVPLTSLLRNACVCIMVFILVHCLGEQRESRDKEQNCSMDADSCPQKSSLRLKLGSWWLRTSLQRPFTLLSAACVSGRSRWECEGMFESQAMKTKNVHISHALVVAQLSSPHNWIIRWIVFIICSRQT